MTESKLLKSKIIFQKTQIDLKLNIKKLNLFCNHIIDVV